MKKDLTKLISAGAILLVGGLSVHFFDLTKRCETNIEDYQIMISPKINYIPDNLYKNLGFFLDLSGLGLIDAGVSNSRKQDK